MLYYVCQVRGAPPPVRQAGAKPFKPQRVKLVQAEQYRRPALRVAEVKARLLGERGKP